MNLVPYELEKTVTDDDLRERQAETWRQLSSEDRETTPEYDLAVGFSPSGDIDEPEPSADSQDGVSLSSSAERLLEDVVENPGKPLTARYDRFANVRKGNAAKNALVDEGVVIERHVHTADGQTKLLELTEKGRTYVEEHLGLDPRQQGRGSAEHRYWQHQIKQAFEELGWTATIEQDDADVYVDLGSVDLAVEVALGDNPREIEHVETHLANGFHVWVACRNAEIRERLQQRMEETDVESERLTFTLVTDFTDVENLPL